MAGTHEAAYHAALRRYVTLTRCCGRLVFVMDPTAIMLTDVAFGKAPRSE